MANAHPTHTKLAMCTTHKEDLHLAQTHTTQTLIRPTHMPLNQAKGILLSPPACTRNRVTHNKHQHSNKHNKYRQVSLRVGYVTIPEVLTVRSLQATINKYHHRRW